MLTTPLVKWPLAPVAMVTLLLGCGESGTQQSTGVDAGAGGRIAVAGNASTAGLGGTSGATAGGGMAMSTAGRGGAPAGGGGATAGAGAAAAAGAAGAVSSGGSGASAGAPFGGRGGAAVGGAGAGSGGAGGRGGSPGGAGAGAAGAAGMTGACSTVTAVPEAVRTRLDLDPFYEKHVDANGLSILGSGKPEDESLLLACRLVENMLSQRDDVRQELIRRKARFAIIGRDEGTAEIPEYGYRGGPQSDIDYINARARGLGGLVASCGEENILCLNGDRYPRESICVHEFSHTLSTYGVYSAEDGFEDSLQGAFDDAVASGILDDTYRSTNLQEYWAEGVQDWYDTNDWSDPPNGVHNDVNTRVELMSYDPALYALVAGVFPEDTAWGDCRDE